MKTHTYRIAFPEFDCVETFYATDKTDFCFEPALQARLDHLLRIGFSIKHHVEGPTGDVIYILELP